MPGRKTQGRCDEPAPENRPPTKPSGHRLQASAVRVLFFSPFFGEVPERRPWVLKHDDAGRFLPGFLFAWFYTGDFTRRFCYGTDKLRYAYVQPAQSNPSRNAA